MLRSSSHSNLLGGAAIPPRKPRLSSSGGAIGFTASSLDSIEIQKVLADERMRSDQHRTNYQLLKAEHSKLLDAHARIENDLANTSAKLKNQMELGRYESLEYQKQISELQKENNILRANQITEERMERIRMEVSEELDEMYRERYNRLGAESAASRAESNRLRYENAFLKSEMECMQTDHKRMLEEITMMHEAEVANLRCERDQLLLSTMKSDEPDKVKVLYRENSQLHVQIKSLKSELEEIMSTKENSINELDLISRNQVKELNSLRSSLRQSDAQRENLKQELEEINREVSHLRTENHQLTDKIHQLQREINQQKHRYEELGHKAHIDLTQLKLEASKQRGEIERQRDILAGKLEEMEYQLQLAQSKVLQLEKAMDDREKEYAERENAYREEERHKLILVDRERALMEEKLSDLQRQVRDQEPNFSSKMERMQESVLSSEQAKSKAEAELLQAQRRADKMETKYQLAQRSVSDLEDRLVRIQREVDEYHEQLKNCTDNLAKKSHVEEELIVVRKNLIQIESQSKETIEKNENEWQNHQREMTKRIRELEEQANNAKSQYCTLQDQQRQKKKKYGQYFLKQKNRIELLEARVGELGTENEILKRNVSHEEYAKVKKELKEMKRRHQQFKSIISTAPGAPGRSDFITTTTTSITEEEFHLAEELKRLKSGQEESELRQKEIASQLQEFFNLQTTLHGKTSIDDCDVASHL